MTKSQNTKNEQQKDLCITSEQLTEQYLNGNLHDGDEYYIQDKDGEISTICLYNTTMHRHSFKVKKLKVLAPVPSYDDWMATIGTAQFLMDKNAQLKELLKECKEVIKNVDTYYGNYDSTNGYLVINKIDEVLK